jgi:hypothetical protein
VRLQVCPPPATPPVIRRRTGARWVSQCAAAGVPHNHAATSAPPACTGRRWSTELRGCGCALATPPHRCSSPRMVAGNWCAAAGCPHSHAAAVLPRLHT